MGKELRHREVKTFKVTQLVSNRAAVSAKFDFRAHAFNYDTILPPKT